MKSLIKLKINHKADSGRKIPWDLIYLVKREDIAISKRLFKYHLIVSDDVQIKMFLKEVPFESVVNHGMARSESFENSISPSKRLGELLDLKDYSLLIPILTRGKRNGKKSLRYLASKQFRRHVKITESAYDYQSNNSREKVTMPSVIVSAGSDLEGYPCTNCENLHAKLLDDKACSLGSAACLTNILLGKGSDFNTSLTTIKELRV